ncbi:hypothetical protein [Paenibacillus sp. LHD-38]|uniref:hypothetical protein n=1 Tax=Paenibacillus sp. LHD-38 TaxID=3072143 RepID=UPI00280E23FB|nr:hypothetical protein [Paenibacillus sp. LHD-38]MDQ8735375.1 hypothetical protein [Paenibacillus sp. LHD-38]
MKSDYEAAAGLIGLVSRHADLLLKHAADSSGETPLFVNALDSHTLAPVSHDPDHVNREALLASPASQ